MMENAASSERDYVTPCPTNSQENIPEQTGPLSLSTEISTSDAVATVVPSNNDEISSSSDDVELTTEKLESVVISDEDQFEDAQSSFDESNSPNNLLTKEKHIFVLSESGKPIFSLHGEEGMLVTLVGPMLALVSVVADSGDTIKSIKCQDTNIVFLVKPPLILVGVSSAGLHTSQLTVQLLYVHSQIVSVLTMTQLARIFEQKPNYDLRRMLTGSERLISSLSNSMDTDPSYFLSAVRCLPLATPTRDLISETIIRYAGKVKEVVFGILLSDNHLISLVRMKKYYIHPADLHLIFNLINSTESFKHSESWTPLCLPKFDSSGFLHAHVSYLTEETNACLIILTTDRNAFFDLSQAKAKIVERLQRHGVLTSISTALENIQYTAASIELPEMRHFLYKSRSSAQFTSPTYAPCYNLPENKKRLNSVYLNIQNRFLSTSQPLKLVHHTSKYEIVLGWLTQSFELYATFGPMTSKLKVITAVNKLLRWIKKEEDKMFILSAPTF